MSSRQQTDEELDRELRSRGYQPNHNDPNTYWVREDAQTIREVQTDGEWFREENGQWKKR